MATRPDGNRVLQLAACMLAMGAVANLQVLVDVVHDAADGTPRRQALRRAGRVHSVRHRADLARPHRGVLHRPIRRAVDRHHRRRTGRARVGRVRVCEFAEQPLRVVRDRRRRRGRRVRRRDWHRAEVVSGSAWACRRTGGRVVRLRHRADGHPHSAHDRQPRLPGRVHLLGHRAGRGGDDRRAVPREAAGGLVAARPRLHLRQAGPRLDPPGELHAVGDGAHADVLDDVRDDDARRVRRVDGRCPAQADCPRRTVSTMACSGSASPRWASRSCSTAS